MDEGQFLFRPSSYLFLTSIRLVKAELGTSNLLSREYEELFGLHHPNILLLMATTSSYPEYRVQLVFEHVALGSLYQCLHIRPVPGLALLLNRIDVLLQVNYFLS